MVEEGKKGAKHVEKVLEEKDKLLSSILICGNFSNIALGAIVTAFTLTIAGNNALSLAIATAIATLIVLIFGEMTPKNIALKYPEKIALLIVRPLQFVMFAISPIASLLNLFMSTLLRPFGFSKQKQEQMLTENELISMLDVGVEEGVIEKDEHKMISGVMKFDEILAKDIMTPRTEMVAVELNFTYDEVLEVFSGAKLSRLPVFDDNFDNIAGVLHIRDFILADGKRESFIISDYMREAYFTLELKRTLELFTEMRRDNISLAIVLDEYGGTAGLLSMEDLLEEIVGEIFDEHDDVKREVEQLSECEYIVSGAMKIDDFNELAGSDLTSDEYESVGGYVMGLAGNVPKKGTSLSDKEGNFSFVVEEVERHRIERLRIKFNIPKED